MKEDIYNYTCSDVGLLLPVINEYTWSTGVRATLYLAGMLWCFLAVAIIADIFMCSIERITSKTKIVKIADSEAKDGYQELEVKVWNDTVANLSLMALGTSAPEIMLSVVEIIKNRFESKELGPSTIVGSAAFNLFCITAVCIVSIPAGEVRKISTIKVYGVTSFFSIFSYIWLILVIMVISPEEVELWEAILTFLMFPLLIVTAYAADKDPCCRKNTRTVSMEIGLEVPEKAPQQNGTLGRRRSSVCHGSAEIIELAKELGKRQDISEEDAAMLAAAKVSEHASHTSNWYRINATRMLVGGVRIKPKVNEKLKPLYESLSPVDPLDYRASRTSLSGIDMSEGGARAVVEFTAASCAVLENEGKVRLGVRRYGNISNAVSVRVETIDGTAEAGSDYKPIKSVIRFAAKEQLTEIFVEIIDDDIWEPDEFFFVKLSLDPSSEGVVLGKTSINQVTIINDDEPGKFEFTKPSYLVKESSGKCVVVVQRVNGGDGKVTVSWKTVDMSAKSGTDFGGGCGLLIFEHGETSKEIEIPVYPSTLEERDQSFQIELMKPTDGSQIGKISRTIVTIVNDDEFNSMVARITNLAVRNLDTLKLDTASWAEQFRAALNVNGGDLDNAGFVDYIMHFSTFFWKVIFAFVPPPSYTGGWLTFIISLALIGALTTIIGDLASVFGCLLSVPDSITAITFVALGTSMPDTFASRAAALNEKTADSSIGNINGSNSVNVFLGLGLPWLIASIYWTVQGKVFRVPVGSLGFSVILYTSAAVVAIIILMIRRRLYVFGKSELGGPKCPKILSALVIFSLWLLYVIMASLHATKVINVSF